MRGKSKTRRHDAREKRIVKGTIAKKDDAN
jgi:hypothetical protein